MTNTISSYSFDGDLQRLKNVIKDLVNNKCEYSNVHDYVGSLRVDYSLSKIITNGVVEVPETPILISIDGHKELPMVEHLTIRINRSIYDIYGVELDDMVVYYVVLGF